MSLPSLLYGAVGVIEVQGLHVGSKGAQRDDRKRHLLLRRGIIEVQGLHVGSKGAQVLGIIKVYCMEQLVLSQLKGYMLARKEHRETTVNGICCCAVGLFL